jgi:hypothetical protein
VNGSGNVTRNPDKSQYNHYEEVTLTAVSLPGYQFDHWSGHLTGIENPASIVMDNNKSVTAYFTQTQETISRPNVPTGPSSGSVGQSLSFSTGGSTSNLGHVVEYRFDWGYGIYSAWGSSSRSYPYQIVGTYTVKAQARCQTHTGVVSSWSSGHTVTISGHTLTISVNGSGNVTRNPDKSQYNHYEEVTLTAISLPGYQFDHWSGHLTGLENPDSIVMDNNKSVTAYFTQTQETISTPNTPTGPSSGNVGQSLSFSTGGSTSNLGHSVEYRFDCGDGYTSAWGSSSLTYSWSQDGDYSVKAQARCAIHITVVSSWSSGTAVTISTTNVEIPDTDEMPDNFELFQNYPNPFNSETSIKFGLPNSCDVKVDVFNINGKYISTLVSGYFNPGVFKVFWDGKNGSGESVPSGLYIYKFSAEKFISVKMMLYLK